MKERPIIFSGSMVRAILDDRKTHTRRVVKGKWLPLAEEVMRANGQWAWQTVDYELSTPHGQPGDRLWVRENWTLLDANHKPINHALRGLCHIPDGYTVVYQADHMDPKGDGPDRIKWRPSIHMPRWASRLTLEVSDLRVERVQDISEGDAECEGVETATPQEATGARYRAAFRDLWDSINGDKSGHSWADNPWVWVVIFKRIMEGMV